MDYLQFTDKTSDSNDKSAGYGRFNRAGDSALNAAGELSLEVWQSFEHSVKQPVLALAEVADHVSGSKLSKGTWLASPAPEEARFGSAKFWAQQTGSTLGVLPWAAALHKVVGAGMHKAVGPGVFESMTTNQLHRYAIAESMITGFTYGALLKPSRCNENICLDNFVQERILVGTTQATTMGLSTFASGKITDWIGRTPTSGQKIATSFLSSGLAGGFDSEVQALRKYGRFATEKELAKGIFTNAVMGAGMTTVQEAFPAAKAESLKHRDSSYGTEEHAARVALKDLPNAVRSAAYAGQSEAVIFKVNPANITPNMARAMSGAPLVAPDAVRILQKAARINPDAIRPSAEAARITPDAARVSSDAARIVQNSARITPGTGPTMQTAQLPTLELIGAPRLVFDRLQQAGLRPTVAQTSTGAEIRLPLEPFQPGPNALLRRTIRAMDEGFDNRQKLEPVVVSPESEVHKSTAHQ